MWNISGTTPASGFQTRRALPVTNLAALPLIAMAIAVSGCSSSSDPDPVLPATTEEILNNASGNIGGSLDSTLDGVSRATTGDSSGDPAVNGVGGLWDDDTQSLVNATLNLGNEDNTVRVGNRITIDPDESTVCAEELVGMAGTQAELQRCEALVRDMVVQVDARSEDQGDVTYLFQNQPLVVIGYGPATSTFEVNLGTLKLLVDAESALNPDFSDASPLDTISGAIRLSAIATSLTSGAEAGSVSISVSRPINVASADAGTSLSLGTGQIFGVTADAATQNVAIELAIGALQASQTEDNGSVSSIDMNGLTAIIEGSNTPGTNLVTVRNLGIGDGPLRIALDNNDVINLGLDTFGFTVANDSGAVTLDGQLNLSLLIREVFGENMVSDTMFSLLEMSAPSGTQVTDSDGPLMVSSVGPLNYSLTTQDDNGNQIVDQVTVNAGQCAEDVGEFADDIEIVSCQ